MRRKSKFTSAVQCSAVMLALAACNPEEEPPRSDEPDAAIVLDEREEIVRSLTQHLPGLDETVEYVVSEADHGASSKYVVRADGRRWPLTWVNSLEREAYRERFGALSPVTAAAIDADPEALQEAFAIAFAPEIAHRLQRDEEVDPAELHQVVVALQELADSLQIEVLSAWDSIMSVSVRGRGTDLRAMAQDPRVGSLTLNQLGEFRETGSSHPDCAGGTWDGTTPNWAHHLLEPFNDAGYYGEGSAFGSPESTNCGIYPKHLTYSNATVEHEHRRTCANDNDCGCNGALSGSASVCLDGHCASVHHNQSASAAIGWRAPNQEWGISRTRLLVPAGHLTAGSYWSGPCTQNGTTAMYDWMRGKAEQRLVTSESWNCGALAPDGGNLQDLFSRMYGDIIMKSAGNLKDDEPSDTIGCARTANSICVGSSDESGSWAGSLWENSPHSDREEPDLLALGQSVDVAACNDIDRYSDNTGSSFAAPTAAAAAILYREACERDWSPSEIRAHFVWAGYGRNAWGTPYSMVYPGYDYRDGGGILNAKLLVGICSGELGPNSGVRFDTINPDLDNDPPLPPWIDYSQPTPPISTTQPIGPVQPLGGPGRAGNPIYAIKVNSGNVTVRASMSWDACPPSLAGGSYTTEGTDYDLMLVDLDNHHVIRSSQSFHDNIEGFQVTLTQPGMYALVYAHNGESCDGSGEEPFSIIASLAGGNVEWDALPSL